MSDVQKTPIQHIYEGLAAKNPDLKEYGFDAFANDMKDENNLKSLYSGLAEKNPTLKETGFDSFKSDIWGDQPDTQQEQPLTYMQKELRARFPENYTNEQNPEVQPQNNVPKESGSVATELNQQLKQGTNETIAAAYGIPGYAYDFVGAGLRALGLDVPTYKESGLTNDVTIAGVDINPLSILDQAKENLLTFSKQNAEKVRELNPDIDKGVVEPIQNGEYKKAIRNLFSSMTQSAPASAAMMLSGGLSTPMQVGAGAALFGSQNLNQADQEGDYGNVSRDAVVAISSVTGALESIFETTFGSGAAGKAISNIIKKEGKEQATETIKKGFTDNVIKLITENPWMAPFGEAYEEMGTQLAQNAVNKYSGYKPDINLMDGVYDAGLLGFGMGSVHGGLIEGTKRIVNGGENTTPTDNTGSQQPTEPVSSDSAPQFTISPRQQVEFDLRSTASQFANNETGLLQTIQEATPDGQENRIWFIKAGQTTDPDGSILVEDEAGNSKFLTKEQIAGEPNNMTIDDFVNMKLSEYDQTQQNQELLKQNQIQIDGKQFILTGDQTNEGLVALNTDDGSETVVPFNVVDKIKGSGTSNANIIQRAYGKTNVTGIKNDDGSITLTDNYDLDKANSLKEEIEKSTGGKATVQAELIPNEDSTLPDSYQLSIIPVQSNVDTSTENAQETNQNDTTPPSQDNNVSTKQQVQPEQPKYTLNGNEIDQATAKARVRAAILKGSADKLAGLEISNDPELSGMIEKAFPKPKAKFTLGKKTISPEDAMDWIIAADNFNELNELKAENIDSEPAVAEAFKAKVKYFTPTQQTIEDFGNIKNQNIENVSKNIQQQSEQQNIENLPTQESSQINQLSNEESENVNREIAGTAQQTENTSQEKQGQGVNERLEENVNKIQSWIDKWEELKAANDVKELDMFYNKVKVALNGYAQGKNVVPEFEALKKDIENYAKEWKEKQSANTVPPVATISQTPEDSANSNNIPIFDSNTSQDESEKLQKSLQQKVTTGDSGINRQAKIDKQSVSNDGYATFNSSGIIADKQLSNPDFVQQELEQAASEVNTNPTEAQKKASKQAKQISPEEQKQRKIDRTKALSIEPSTIEQLILQYIVAGNRLNWDEIKREVFPRSHSEIKQRIWMLKKDGKTIDQLLGLLNGTPMEEEGNQPNAFRNTVIDAVLRNGTRTQMVDRILEIGDQNNNQQNIADYEQRMAEAAEAFEQEERNNELLAWEEYLTELENNGQLPTENELIELFLQDNTTTNEQSVNQTGSLESDGSVNPEENEGNRQVIPGSKPGNDGKNAIKESPKELTPLEKEIQSLQKERAELLSKKVKTVKNVNVRNGLFGDIAAQPNDLFAGQGFDATEAQRIIKSIDDRISVIDQTIEDLSAKNEQVKATAEKENAGQQEINIPDRTLEAKQVQDVAGQDSGQRPAVKEPWEMTRDELINHQINRNSKKITIIKQEIEDLLKTSPNTTKGNLTVKSKHNSNGLIQSTEWYKKHGTILNSKLEQVKKLESINKKLVIDNNDLISFHKTEIKKSLSEGKPVPEEVLNDYPELKPVVQENLNTEKQRSLEQVLEEGKKKVQEKKQAEIEKQSTPLPEEKPASNYGENNKIVSKERADELRKRLRDKLNNLNAGFDPEVLAIGTELAAYHIEAGARKFADFSKAMIDDIGDAIKPYLKAIYNGARDLPGMEELEPEMTEYAEVKKANIDEILKQSTENNVQSDKNKDNVSNRSNNSQPDSQQPNDAIANDEGTVSGNGTESGRNGNTASRGSSQRNRRSGSKVGSGLFTLSFGEQSDNELPEQNPQQAIEVNDAGNFDGRGSRIDGTEGLYAEQGTDESNNQNDTPVSGSFAERAAEKLKQQKAAEGIKVVTGDIDNIRETLPFLLSEQQDDVLKAETRFYSPEHQTKEKAFGKGILFTNGTGTGKTYTGLGIVKRFVKQGKSNILIVVPSQPKVTDWANDGKNLGLDITPLPDTSTGGTGVVVTTYANLRENEELKKREFDLIMYDESHRLMEEKNGATSSTTMAHYQISNKDEWSALSRLQDIHPVWKEHKKLNEEYRNAGGFGMWSNNSENADKLQKMLDRLKFLEKEKRELESELREQAKEAVKRTKVVFLSATPFKAHFNLRYVNGYLFDWGNETTYQGSSRVNPEARFFLDNFGSAYDWKYHRLQTKSNANAEAIAMQEVQFAERLMAEGVISGRTINSEQDYGREFPKVTGLNTEEINKALADIYNYETKEFEGLRAASREVFYNYNYTTQLFEALKSSMSIPRIEKHLDLGRKVVVFHRRKQANVRPPFESILDMTRMNAKAVLANPDSSDREKDEATLALAHADAFETKYAGLLQYEQTLNYNSAIDQINSKFGDRAVYINGDVSKKDKANAIKQFNTDGSGVDIIVVQEESGKEGISLHDTTGKHQRVLMSMSMPISSVTALQIEGRIYRIGQESDAIFEYPLLGLDMEVEYFGRNINRRLSTTENLAVGEQSRDLIRSFAEGVLFNSDIADPHSQQGKGGKEYDRKVQQAMSEFRRAVLVYQSNQKVRGKRDERDGIDYFATPEPVGQKMVEWLYLQPGETGMEPSAGHGAIAMWFPNHANITAIEPSFKLYSKLNARSGGGEKKVINSTFEDHNIINKYHGIAMNPPFGSGGKTAMDHVEKAFHHLKDRGRLIAIIPNGPSMTKRLDNFLYGEDEKGRQLNPEAYLIGEIQLPSSTFEQAGTQVSSRIVIIERHVSAPDNLRTGIKRDLSDAKNVNELFDRIEDISMPERTKQGEKPRTDFIGLVNNVADRMNEGKQGEYSGYEAFEQKDTRDGSTLYMTKPTVLLDRDQYRNVADIAKKHDGYWSRYENKAQGIKAGFLFKSEENRTKFLNEVTGNTPQFRIIGETGAANLDKAEEATTRLDNLAIAREMEQSGKDVKFIRLATGWEKGVDGKWRYEVPDDIVSDELFEFIGTKYSTYESVNKLETKLKNLRNKLNNILLWKGGDTRDSIISEINQTKQQLEKENKLPVKNGTYEKRSFKLSDISPSISESYPFISNLLVEITIDDTYSGNGKGEFGKMSKNDKGAISITLPENPDIENAKSIIIHEIQHAIQDIEGFARGGNTKEFKGEREVYIDILQAAKNALHILNSDNKERAKEELEALGLTNDNISKLTDDYIKIYPESTIKSIIQTEEGILDPHKSYTRLAGEVESRNVQTRMNMTPEERLNTLLSETEDVSREDQIVLMDGLGVSNLDGDFEYTDHQNLIDKLESGAIETDEVILDDNEGLALQLAGKISENDLNEIRNSGRDLGGFELFGKVYINSVISPIEVVKTWIHEKTHRQLKRIFPQKARREQFLNRVFDHVGEKEINSTLPKIYHGDSREQRAEEYIAFKVQEYGMTGNVNADPEIKKIIFELLNRFTTLKNIQDATRGINLAQQGAGKRNAHDGLRGRSGLQENGRTGRNGEPNFSRGLRQDESRKGTKESRIAELALKAKNNPSVFSEYLSEAKRVVSEKQSQPENTILIDGKLRSTVNSKGLPIAQTEEGIRNFWKWFSGSKVVDEEGRPLVVYHGTNEQFNEFSIRGRYFGYFTDQKKVAKDYGNNIGSYYLKIEDLEEYDSKGGWWKDNYGNIERLNGRLERKLIDGFVIANTQDPKIFDDTKKFPVSNIYVVSDPSQIKSATSNDGSFDPDNNDIRYRRGEVPLNNYLEEAARQNQEAKKTRRNLSEVAEGVREFIQDHDLPIRRLEEKVKQLGGKIADNMKPYRDMSLSYGRMETLYKNFTKEKFEPIIKTISKIVKSGTPAGEVLPYVICKHALERNPYMRAIELKEWQDNAEIELKKWTDANIDIPQATKDRKVKEFTDALEAKRQELSKKDYSGVRGFDPSNNFETPDELAQEIVDEFERKTPIGLVDELWSNVKNATSEIVDIWGKGQTMSEEQVQQTKDRFKYFVPLRGWRHGVAKQLVYKKGEGFSGSLQRIKGRTSIAENPLAYIEQIAFKALGEQVDNEVKTSLLNLVVGNYGDDFQQLYRLKKAYYIKDGIDEDGEQIWRLTTERPSEELFKSGDAVTKIYNQYQKLRTPSQAHEHEVYVKRPNGDLVVVMVGDMLPVAQAMNKKNTMYRNIFTGKPNDAEFWNKPLSATIGAWNNTLKGMYTAYNIVFPITNFMRDAQEASITQFIKGDNGHLVVKNYKNAFPAIIRSLRGKESGGKYDEMLKEFRETGGNTGYTHLKTPEQLEKEINSELEMLNRTGTFRGYTIDKARKALSAIEAWNQIFEDATRFSVYITSREAGKSAKEAANDSKEASVNFNRKGKSSKAFDSVWAFWNVAIQSMQKNFKLAKDHKGKFGMVAGAWLALGFLEAMMNDAMGGDDDKDYYNISDYVRENYLIIPILFGDKKDKYLRIPLPQFWRGFKSAGSIAYDVMNGKMDGLSATAKGLGNFLGGLLPIDIGGFYQNGEFSMAPVIPTVINPGYEISKNRDYMGYTIAKEPFTKEQERLLADSGLGKENVSPAIKFFTDYLFRAGGGDNETRFYAQNGDIKKVPGIFDYNPSYIEHLITGYTGGTGKFVTDVLTTAIDGLDSEKEVDFRNAPFINQFIKKIPEAKWKVIGEYYDIKSEGNESAFGQLKRSYFSQEDKTKYKEVAGSNYLNEYNAVVNAYDKRLTTMMQYMDYKTAEGSEEVINTMKDAIEAIKQVKQKYNKK